MSHPLAASASGYARVCSIIASELSIRHLCNDQHRNLVETGGCSSVENQLQLCLLKLLSAVSEDILLVFCWQSARLSLPYTTLTNCLVDMNKHSTLTLIIDKLISLKAIYKLHGFLGVGHADSTCKLVRRGKSGTLLEKLCLHLPLLEASHSQPQPSNPNIDRTK